MLELGRSVANGRAHEDMLNGLYLRKNSCLSRIFLLMLHLLLRIDGEWRGEWRGEWEGLRMLALGGSIAAGLASSVLPNV